MMPFSQKTLRQLLFVSGLFMGLTALLLLFNYLQISKSDPLESKTLTVLVDRLVTEPGNEALAEEVRQLDLLARKAYFNSVWQLKTGAALLLAGAIAFVVFFRLYLRATWGIDEPDTLKSNTALKKQKTQQWMLVATLLLLVSGGLAALLNINQFNKIQDSALTEAQPQDDGIERLELLGVDSLALSADSLPLRDSTVLADSQASTDSAALAEVVKAVIPLNATTVKQQHNSFRGAYGQGISTRKGIPTDWNGKTGKNVKWKTAIPINGFNSPVVWDGLIFLSGATASKRVVYCLDRQTGAIRWQREANNISGSPAVSPKTTDDTGLAAPSLAVDGDRVYALFGNGDILALDHEGNRQWARNLGVPDNHYGHASSLITWGGKVFVQYDTHSGSKVMALNTTDGKTAWTTPRSNDVSWSSPILASIGGKWQLVLQANPNVAGYDLQSGRQLWSVDCMTGEVGPSPAFGGGYVYAANEYAKLVAIDPATSSIVWESMDKLPEVASPAYVKGLLFTATTYAVLGCFDATNGELLWEHEASAGFYASPMVAEGKLYVFDTSGKAYIFAPGRSSNLISSPELGEKVYSTPAFSDGCLYVRGVKHLYCLGK